MKRFLWIGLLASGWQAAWAFSLLGPDASYTPQPNGDKWQTVDIAYSEPNANVPPWIGDSAGFGPKNQGEGYRRNTPVMYYTFDSSFGDYFGSNGEYAVQQAFDILNNAFTNNPAGEIDGYSPYLSEFPLNSEGENYTAYSLDLVDVKSFTLSVLLEQLGLADAIRYTWTLHNRTTLPGCQAPCPNCLGYLVVMRNFDYYLTPLGYVPPDWGQYSPYINGALYGYQILENCGIPNPPSADAYEIPADPTIDNPPVASGLGEGRRNLNIGLFYAGLTRDDAAGLRWLYGTNNYDTPSAGYLESPAAGSVFFSTNVNTPQLLFTSNLNVLVTTSLTNSPAVLQTLYPGLSFDPNPPSYFSNVVSMVVTNYTTNLIGYSQPINVRATNYVTNIVQFYLYSFGNVVTNKSYAKTTYKLQTITVGPPMGSPAGSAFVTNITYRTYQSNVVSGDFFVITNGTCGPNILQTLQTNVEIVTNTIVTNSSLNGEMFVQNLISYSTNHVLVVQPCTFMTNALGDYRGIGKIRFVRVPDDYYDYQSTQLYPQYWITNQYAMVVLTNGQYVTRTFQRVVTTPDFLFSAVDLEFPTPQGGNGWTHDGQFMRNVAFNQNNEGALLAGPGTIDPPSTITFNKVGPDYVNVSTPYFQLFGPGQAYQFWFIWASFDATTNMPVVYPNGASLANLSAEALVQIFPPPPTLPDGTNNVPYSFVYTNSAGIMYTNTFSAIGGQPPYTWLLATGSAGLPPGLNLSPSGNISGTPAASGTYDNIVIQMMDASTPPRTLQMTYSLTIN